MTAAVSHPAPQASVIVAITPIMAVVLAAFLVIGLGLPVLPSHVYQTLGFGTIVIGLVTGSPFAASLLSRFWSGHTSDFHGAKVAVMIGLTGASSAGIIYLLSLYAAPSPTISVIVLLAGRGVLGAAESFIIPGATMWGLARVGAANAGKVIAWMGTAMFAAFAVSAPIGVTIYSRYGFAGIAVATALAPLVTLALVALV